MQKKCGLSLFLFILINAAAFGQKSHDTVFRRHFIGSSCFMAANLFPKSQSFYQLNYGYWLTKKDVLSVEAKTWTYKHPIGIPYGPDKYADAEAYPGSVQAIGLGLAYQHFWWKGAYSGVDATVFRQGYRDLNKKEIQNGIQLFTSLRFGYHVRLFHNRFFVEPSVAFTYWPVNTNLPASFRVKEDKWNNYFLFEPGLHFGYKF